MTNSLGDEESPYLLQHSDNPVEWYPWCDEAFEEARERDVPVFLSVGYSACHWCHVMEDESFEDAETAEILNDNFVSIKVDREERPDVDRLYQTVCQMTTGQGGWPLSVFLTPDGRPFYAGTYYPPEPKHGRPSFRQVLENVVESWGSERDELEQQADELTVRARDQMDGEAAGDGELVLEEEPEESPLEAAADEAVEQADREFGGFGRGQKFPHPVRVEALLRSHNRNESQQYLDVAVEMLDAMSSGGLYDHVGGGFHRYCVDRGWTVPHFEKMLYDNALLPLVYLQGYQVTGRDRYAETVRETFDFLEREMRDDDGGFCSTLDAVSDDGSGEDVEGAYYTWTPEQVEEAMEPEVSEAFIERYGVTEEGDVEAGSVLNLEKTAADVAAHLELDLEKAESLLTQADSEAREARERRPRPRLDDKVLSSWNGLAVSAYAEAETTLPEDGYADTAEEVMAFLRNEMWDGDTLYRRYRDGDVAVEGYLEDYAFVSRGALHLYEATGDIVHLEFALSLADVVVEEFQADDGGFYFTRGDDLVVRPREQTDSSTPSSAGVAARTLAVLSAFDPSLEDVAREAVDSVDLISQPLAHVSLALADDRMRTGATEVVVPDLDDWRGFLEERYLPARLVTELPEDLESAASTLGVDDVPPVWRGRDDGGAGFVCQEFTCSPPLSGPEEAEEWLEDRR